MSSSTCQPVTGPSHLLSWKFSFQPQMTFSVTF
jgi:hypothetical protein